MMRDSFGFSITHNPWGEPCYGKTIPLSSLQKPLPTEFLQQLLNEVAQTDAQIDPYTGQARHE